MSSRARVSSDAQPTVVKTSATAANAGNTAGDTCAVKIRDMRCIARAAAAILAGCTALVWAQDQLPETSSAPSGWSSPARAPSDPTWRLIIAPYTVVHFSYSPDHKQVIVLGAEREHPNGVVWGGTVFDNSFGQPSAYGFVGQRLYGWSPWDALYAEWTVGILYGYTGQYKHKVPLNYNGFAPGAVGGVGWKFTKTVAGQVNILGTSALMFQLSVDLP
jgi:hypothetical protein